MTGEKTEIVAAITDYEPKNILGQLQMLPVERIDSSNRLREVDSIVAEAIAASIAKDGLLNPIDVCRLPGNTNYLLVAGGHRLEAFRLLGLTDIPAFVRSYDALDRKAREIAENVFKAGLTPIDRANFVAEFYAIEKARAGIPVDGDGRAFSAGVRWQKTLKKEGSNATAMIAGAYKLQAHVAERLGLSERTIRNDLLLYKRISPEIVDQARKSKIGDNAAALRQLAALEPLEQKRAVAMLAKDTPYKTLGQVMAIIQKKAAPDPEKKRLSTFIGTFSRMGRAEKFGALMELASLVPNGAAIVLPGNVNGLLSTEEEQQLKTLLTKIGAAK